jgi:hypothetical protein
LSAGAHLFDVERPQHAAPESGRKRYRILLRSSAPPDQSINQLETSNNRVV